MLRPFPTREELAGRRAPTGGESESVKVVGHSHGAAHAAGLAWSLLSQGINVEFAFYIAPHQPNQFATHPYVRSFQFSRSGDKVSSQGLIAMLTGSEEDRIDFVDVYIEALATDKGRGGHYVETYFGAGGINRFIKEHGDLWDLLVQMHVVNPD